MEAFFQSPLPVERVEEVIKDTSLGGTSAVHHVEEAKIISLVAVFLGDKDLSRLVQAVEVIAGGFIKPCREIRLIETPVTQGNDAVFRFFLRRPMQPLRSNLQVRLSDVFYSGKSNIALCSLLRKNALFLTRLVLSNLSLPIHVRLPKLKYLRVFSCVVSEERQERRNLLAPILSHFVTHCDVPHFLTSHNGIRFLEVHDVAINFDDWSDMPELLSLCCQLSNTNDVLEIRERCTSLQFLQVHSNVLEAFSFEMIPRLLKMCPRHWDIHLKNQNALVFRNIEDKTNVFSNALETVDKLELQNLTSMDCCSLGVLDLFMKRFNRCRDLMLTVHDVQHLRLQNYSRLWKKGEALNQAWEFLLIEENLNFRIRLAVWKRFYKLFVLPSTDLQRNVKTQNSNSNSYFVRVIDESSYCADACRNYDGVLIRPSNPTRKPPYWQIRIATTSDLKDRKPFQDLEVWNRDVIFQQLNKGAHDPNLLLLFLFSLDLLQSMCSTDGSSDEEIDFSLKAKMACMNSHPNKLHLTQTEDPMRLMDRSSLTGSRRWFLHPKLSAKSFTLRFIKV